MLRLGLAAAQGQDQGLGCDCNELPAGRLCGVPMKFSIYLVFYGLYSAVGLAQQQLRAPWWVVLGLALGGLLLLFATILVHEFGHGLTARRLGGEILYILLWPLGGLCLHTLPQHRSKPEKLWNDWWVTFNGPCTHLVMIPCWVAVSALLYVSFGLRYSAADLWSDLNPLSAAGALSRHPEAVRAGWGAVLLLQLCATAISLNVLLLLFNVLFPMYPMDSSKLLVTGMQLCGVPAQSAARRFIWISGACVLLLLGLTALHLCQWVASARPGDYERAVQIVGMGLLPLPLSVLLTLGLGLWGGKQTWELHQLLQAQRLHHHPLFCHVPYSTRMVRDIDNGRPDLFVEQRVDRYDDAGPAPAPTAASRASAETYGAVRIVGGQITR